MKTRLNVLIQLVLAFLLGMPCVAHAAESYDNCTGFITTIPAVISTQGTWCFKQDLNSAITTGNAITIAADNVTLDCNDFKLDGLGAGMATLATGLSATDRLNATVRHCNIRGFYRGLFFTGINGGGHTVEDNRFDGNSYTGLRVDGDGSTVRLNRVVDTGGSTGTSTAFGIIVYYSVDILDNTVSGVVARSGGNGTAYGIYASTNSGGSIIGNRVRTVLKDGTGTAQGILVRTSSRLALRNNDLVGDASIGSVGLNCNSADESAVGNVISGFAISIAACTDSGGNVVVP